VRWHTPGTLVLRPSPGVIAAARWSQSVKKRELDSGRTTGKLPTAKGFLSGDNAADTLPAVLYSFNRVGRTATDVARLFRRVPLTRAAGGMSGTGV